MTIPDHGRGFREATAFLVAKRRLEAIRGDIEDIDPVEPIESQEQEDVREEI